MVIKHNYEYFDRIEFKAEARKLYEEWRASGGIPRIVKYSYDERMKAHKSRHGRDPETLKQRKEENNKLWSIVK